MTEVGAGRRARGVGRDVMALVGVAARPTFWLLVGIGVSEAYLYGAALLNPRGTLRPLPVPLYIPQAVVLSVLLLSPRRVWVVLLAEYFLLLSGHNLWIRGALDWRVVLSTAGPLIESLVGALLIRRLIALPPKFDELRAVGLYAACVAVAAAVGATWGTAVWMATGVEVWSFWRGWFLSDGLASLLLAPAILLWVGALATGTARLVRQCVPEAAALALGLLAAGWVAFGTSSQGPDTAPVLLYLPVPLLLWAAVRFGPLGLASALSVLVVFAVAGVANGLGPFVDRPREASQFTLQMFLLAIGAPMFALAALVRERQQAQAGLARSEALYRAVVRNFPRGAVLLFGADLRHLFVDGEGLPNLGLRRETALGKSPAQAFPATVAAALTPRYQSALSGEYASLDVAHEGRTYQVQVVPITDPGGAVGLAVLQDVTEERRAAEMAELDRARTAFFSNVSHQLRTPLTLLLGPLQEVLAAPPERLGMGERQVLKVAHRNAARLLQLVNSLLDFSRLQAGHQDASFVPTDLSAYTTDLASAFRSAVEQAGLALVVNCQPLPQPVYVDREQWEHVVFNLLSNALKSTFAGRIEVSLREVGGQAVLAVADTGTGIPAADLPHLFNRFHRVAGARMRSREGTGIGLALVQEVTRLHGGEVRVNSTIGEGSVFEVAIPLGAAHLPVDQLGTAEGPARLSSAARHVEEAWRSSPADAAPAPAASQSGPDRPARLLVVDDNADMRSYLAHLLRGCGDVQQAGDGADALALARSWEPDLILADVMMADVDGLALLHAVRADPRLRTVPVVMLSAQAGDEARVEALRAGADDYLVKPFVAAELLARIDAHLGLVHLRDEASASAERRRLARELHDSVTQALFAANMTADVLPRVWEQDPEDGHRALQELRRLTGSALAEMRSLLLELRPDALVRTPLHQVLATLVSAMATRTTTSIEGQLDPSPPLPPDVHLALYRIAQEALSNSIKHARAKQITVSLRAAQEHGLTLAVADDGQGLDPDRPRPGRLGLTSIHERAEAIGASLDVCGRPGGGTTVSVTWAPGILAGPASAERMDVPA